jgi:hypothetical protein
MDELKGVLAAVGVLSWLRDRFPGLSEDELLRAVDGDFENLIGELEMKGPQS